MSFASDRRGRVPFALVGVLLLVGATTYATGLAQRAPPSVERPATEAMDGVTRDARPAIGAAVRDAARASMRRPVTEPAETPVGRVVNDSQPFLDSFRIRIAVAARDRLGSVERRRDGVRASVSLPPIADADDLERAKRDVRLEPLPANRSVRVTLHNVSVRATRGESTLAERTVNVTLVVSTPAFALHHRTERYQSRLDRGPLEGAGLGRGLTARLYPVTWARAYGRYQGAPIQNVLANRHVELSTNGALLAQQRAVFGRADPDGARGLQVATAETGVVDVLGSSPRTDRVTSILRPNAADDGDEFDPPRPDTSPVNATPAAAADDAYLDVTDGLAGDLEASYRVEASLRTDVERTDVGHRPSAVPPGENWSLATTTRSENTTVLDGKSEADVSSPSRLERSRRVVVTHSEARYWVGPDGVAMRTVEWTDRYRVDVAVVASYEPRDGAGYRPVEPLFRRGGAMNESNLRGVARTATRELLRANGDADGVAVKVVQGDDLTRRRVETSTPTGRVEDWVAADLWTLRERVANVSVTTSHRRVASGGATPAGELAAELDSRRTALVDAPARYDGVADRARVAARAAYLEAVIRELETRADEADERNDDYLDAAADRTAREVSSLVAIGAAGDGPFRRRGGSSTSDGLVTVPDGSPAYLTLEAVRDDHVPSVPAGESVHPLAARNENWFTVPYGDAADEVAGALFPPDSPKTSLASASQALVAANRTAANGSSAALDRRRENLASAVGSSVQSVERKSCRNLAENVTEAAQHCEAAVAAASRRWSGAGRRGLAVANGSYARAVGEELRARGVAPGHARVATVHLQVQHRRLAASESIAVDGTLTNATVSETRSLAREATTELVETELENATKRTTTRLTGGSRIPAGLPVAPAPGYWYATVNGWSVTVRGEYQRFAVSSYAGAPDGAGGLVTYVRDGGVATLDVDGDGDAERLGTSERVAFETGTVVVVAVPPGPTGVGDVNGDRNETSPGWPCPGLEMREEREESCAGADG